VHRPPTPSSDLLARSRGRSSLRCQPSFWMRVGQEALSEVFESADFDLSKLSASRSWRRGEGLQPAAESGRPLGLIEPGLERCELSDASSASCSNLWRTEVPAWLTALSRVPRASPGRPARQRGAFVCFPPGWLGSGSPRSPGTCRRAALRCALSTVSLLDGTCRAADCRRLTSARQDMDLNIARSVLWPPRSRGIAVSPSSADRPVPRRAGGARWSRRRASCSARVRRRLRYSIHATARGLYAQRRAGVIALFNRISDPRGPDDADLASTRRLCHALRVPGVLAHLTRGGCWLRVGLTFLLLRPRRPRLRAPRRTGSRIADLRAALGPASVRPCGAISGRCLFSRCRCGR